MHLCSARVPAMSLVHPTVSAPLELSRPEVWWRARAWQTNLCLLFLGLLLFLLSRHLVVEYEDYIIGFSGTSGWSVWCYALASFLVLTQPTNRWTLPIVLGVAVLCRLTPLFADAVLSSDVYRYVWDGIVQQAGINPYRYVPADPAIAALRSVSEGNIFPAINRATYAHTIYPPFAQIFFWCVAFVSPTLVMMKTTLVLCEGVTVWCLLWLLRALGRPREQVILYAWAPILIWEIAGSGHLDSLAMALIGLALVARYQRRPVATGVFLALAVLTKLYPLVLFPALYMRHPVDRKTGHVRRSLEWTMPAIMTVLIVGGYAAYSSVGRLVFGFLGGYVEEEGMASGARYFLLDLAHHVPGLARLPIAAFFVVAVLVFAGLIGWCWQAASPEPGAHAEARQLSLREQLRPHQAAGFLPPAFALAGALMLLFSPHYAWYIIWLVPFFTLLPVLPALGYVMGFFYLYTTALAAPGPKMFLANEILYGILVGTTVLQVASRYLAPLRINFWADRGRLATYAD